jgi:hypothetical protein
MINENLNVTGKLKIELFDGFGGLKSSETVDNLVVTSGLSYIASRIKDATATAMSHMAIGSGTSAAVLADTALGTELGRVALTSTSVTTNAVTYSASFGAGVGTGAVAEAGLFNASSAGTMLCRTVFSVVNKSASDVLVITWVVTIS